MKIGIDFDDVITNFTYSLMNFCGKKYGKRVLVEENHKTLMSFTPP